MLCWVGNRVTDGRNFFFYICLFFIFFIKCYFTIKVVRAEAAGAAGVIVTDQVGTFVLVLNYKNLTVNPDPTGKPFSDPDGYSTLLIL
jgi:hypothetical protein